MPIDFKVKKELERIYKKSLPILVSWTEMITKEQYLAYIEKIKDIPGEKSIADWELKIWNKS